MTKTNKQQNINNFLTEKCSIKNALFVVFFLFLLSNYEKILNTLILYLFCFLIIIYLIENHLIKIKKNTLYIGKCFIIVFIIFEIIFSYLQILGKQDIYSSQSLRIEEKSTEYTEYDAILGYKLKENLSGVQSKMKINSHVIYDIEYESDEYSRRINNNTYKSRDLQKHALFLGGSFTFGEGLMYTETFPYIFEKLHPRYKSYNYGFKGYGPHQFALFFPKHSNLINKSSVPEDQGLMIYTYIDDHLNRVFGGSRYLTYGKDTPDVHIKNGKIIVSKRKKGHLLLASFIKKSSTLRYFHITVSYPEKKSYYKRFANIVNYIAKEYNTIYPNNKFYVSIYPGEGNDLQWLQYLEPNIYVIQTHLPKDYEVNIENYVIDKNYDPHPNFNLNDFYIRALHSKIFPEFLNE